MTKLDELIAQPQLAVIYDGECPFCSNYVSMLRIKETVGAVALLNARHFPDLVSDLANRGMRLDDGMIVIYQSRVYFAEDALHVLSVLSTGSGVFNKFIKIAFDNPRQASLIYPVLRACRNFTLKLLGRTQIQNPAN